MTVISGIFGWLVGAAIVCLFLCKEGRRGVPLSNYRHFAFNKRRRVFTNPREEMLYDLLETDKSLDNLIRKWRNR